MSREEATMTTNGERPGDRIRVGDADRNEAVRQLGEHFEAGRLTADEHSARVDQALRASTRADLDALFTDLPDAGTGQAWPGPASGAAGETGPGWQREDQRGKQEGSRQRGPFGAGGLFGSGAPFGGPPWARGAGGRRLVFGLPLALLALVGVLAVAGVACAVFGGHPPVLPLLAVLILGVFVLRRRLA
jgi:hypothetical protein